MRLAISLRIINTVLRIFGRACAGTDMAGTMETHITNAHASYGHKQSLYLDSFGCVISVTTWQMAGCNNNTEKAVIYIYVKIIFVQVWQPSESVFFSGLTHFSFYNVLATYCSL